MKRANKGSEKKKTKPATNKGAGFLYFGIHPIGILMAKEMNEEQKWFNCDYIMGIGWLYFTRNLNAWTYTLQELS